MAEIAGCLSDCPVLMSLSLCFHQRPAVLADPVGGPQEKNLACMAKSLPA